MSVTEIQLIHTVVQAPSTTRFLLPTECDKEDKGLMMRLDGKLNETTRAATSTTGITTTRTSIPIQLCGQTQAMAGWALWAASLLQTAHICFIKITQEISDAIQMKAMKMLPLLVYMSLLVLAIQTCALIVMFAMSTCPKGLWFLLGCIAIICKIFCSTASPTNLNPYCQSTRPHSAQASS